VQSKLRTRHRASRHRSCPAPSTKAIDVLNVVVIFFKLVIGLVRLIIFVLILVIIIFVFIFIFNFDSLVFLFVLFLALIFVLGRINVLIFRKVARGHSPRNGIRGEGQAASRLSFCMSFDIHGIRQCSSRSRQAGDTRPQSSSPPS